MGLTAPPLFRGVQASATTIAVPLKIVAGCIGIDIQFDAVAAATFFVEVTSSSIEEAPVFEGGAGTELTGEGHAYLAGAAAQHWTEIPGASPAALVAGSAGAVKVDLSGIRQKRARLRITSTAICSWNILDGIAAV